MRQHWVASLLVCFCFLAVAQHKTPAQRKDSVTVSAGISKEQLQLEDRLGAVLAEGDSSLKAGHPSDAVKQYEAALEMVHKEPLLAEQETKVLTKAGNGYLAANRSADAIASFQRLMDVMKCGSETTQLSTCGDAQRSIGLAKMQSEDFEGGLSALRLAESSYLKAEKQNEEGKTVIHEYTMLQIMDQGKTKLLIAVALFRLGKAEEAKATAEDAITQLNRVKDDKSINTGICESATRSLSDAHTILDRFKSAQ
jgi:tetratricopeptide (TPR) repeat protein